MERTNGRVIRGVAANGACMGGTQFESEIREQPGVLARIAASPDALRLENTIGGRDVVFTGSGSSLFVAQLAALAWQRRGRRAIAVAASEARFLGAAAPQACVIALSQSGRTRDVLDAVDAFAAAQTIALTNDATSPLAARADATIDIAAGAERAVPASKSVTAMAAILLASAASRTDGVAAAGRALAAAAAEIERWLAADARDEVERVARSIEPAQSIIVIGAGFGVPIADEIALKIKEATYRHAEGFGAGEFRHGSTAMLDATSALLGIVDPWSQAIVGDVLGVAGEAHALTATIGAPIGTFSAFGPALTGTFAPIGWIVAGQLLALTLARRAGIDSDTPRGLRKYLA
jgi:glucosamine--fructose-6-phosphate aminotransferase (isomerizing)